MAFVRQSEICRAPGGMCRRWAEIKKLLCTANRAGCVGIAFTKKQYRKTVRPDAGIEADDVRLCD